MATIRDLQSRLGDIVMTASHVKGMMRHAYISVVGGDHAQLLAAGMGMGPMTKTILKITASAEAKAKHDPSKLAAFVKTVKALDEHSDLWHDRNAAVHGEVVGTLPMAFNQVATRRSQWWPSEPPVRHWTREQLTKLSVDLENAGLDLLEAWSALFNVPMLGGGPRTS